ncbi:hypothetical protein LTR28_007685 [Elasticomyces elasticus]|nr:hypothetical protein LTR28_007685 [Elasticomyces elasticus]
MKHALAREYEDNHFEEDSVFLERNSRDFVSRIERINVNAEAICEVLTKHPRVKQVNYPKSSPTRKYYDQCRLPSGGYGGLLSATFHSVADAAAFYDNLDTCKGPSLGTNFTLSSPFVILAHYIELDWAASYGVEASLVRFSVGLEDSEALKAVFQRALAAIPAAGVSSTQDAPGLRQRPQQSYFWAVMDIIVSLAHFCEIHGPTSILCTQVLPLSCDTCNPDDLSSPSSHRHHRPSLSVSPEKAQWLPSVSKPTTRLSPLNSPFETPPTSPHISKTAENPYFPSFSSRASYHRYSGSFEAEGESCASCTFEVPKEFGDKLPEGAPGSPKRDGRGRNGSPVLRSKESVLAWGGLNDDSSDEEDYSNDCFGPPDGMSDSDTERTTRPGSINIVRKNATRAYSIHSSASTYSSHSAFSAPPEATHSHSLTFLTTRTPPDPRAYSTLRRSCIATLSTESLPRGLSSGPLTFGNASSGCTTAYVFRVPDPRARGHRRTYALLALSKGGSWKVARRRCFLSAKTVDPDGYPRVTQQAAKAKSLSEIVGDEWFFVELHSRFVWLLKNLVLAS